MAVMHIFGEYLAATRLPGAVNNHCFPEGKPAKQMQVYRCEDVIHGRLNDIKACVDFSLLTRKRCVNVQLSRGVGEVLLQYLNRDNPGFPAQVLLYQGDSFHLFGGIR